ncbi:MAG: type II toxin-antitoxin system RelE/ParE family toxin [Candidatus Altiarchaeota archaeon]|nr:type II toxin-antitoxin system RelE/ParE family toxin [Candidatus Altiarchaeota archaeon]
MKDTPFHRIRVGDYRVIIQIENNKMVIFVIEVGHRKNIYK